MMTDPTICGTFTKARRYPLIVARLWGHRISLNATVGVLGGLAVVWATRGLWQHGAVAGQGFKVYLIAGLSGGVFLQRGRLDGRAPLWSVYSIVVWLATDLPGATSRWMAARSVELSVPSPPPDMVMSTVSRPVQRWTTSGVVA